MSIVAVHGPYTFGSRAIVEAGPAQATVNPANGMIWTFKLDAPTTRVAADFDWTYTPAGGTPASPINDTFSPVITFTGAGAKSVTLTVTGAGAGNNPYPPAGTYPISVTTVSGAAPQLLMAPGGDEEQAASPDEELPEDEESPEGEAFDPGDHTIEEVMAYVDANPDEAHEVLEAEREGKARVTLLTQLEDLTFDPAEYTVTQVIGYVEDHPEKLDDVIAAEQTGRNRTTLIAQLEGMREA